MSDLEAFERADRVIQRAADTWTDSSLLPPNYRDKDGTALVGDVLLACGVLLDLDISPRLNLPETYVVKGRLGFYAGLQRSLARRGGYDLDLVEVDEHHATVEIGRIGDVKTHLVTVTMEMARRAGWVARNPNYNTMPERMLAARASTWAISLYAAEVMHGIQTLTARPLAWDLDPPEAEGVPELAEGDER